jgi:hypothetical protein
MVSLVGCIHEDYVGKGTTENQWRAKGRDVPEDYRGSTLGVGEAKVLEVAHDGGEDGKNEGR